MPLEVLPRVSRLARHLDLARRRASAGRGLEPWEFAVLSARRRAADMSSASPPSGTGWRLGKAVHRGGRTVVVRLVVDSPRGPAAAGHITPDLQLRLSAERQRHHLGDGR